MVQLASCPETLAVSYIRLCIDNKITDINTSPFMTLGMPLSPGQFTEQESGTVLDITHSQTTDE
jgi:hypothetical protein